MPKSVKVIFINVNSIVSRTRRHYIQNFTDEQKPDVLMMAEHKLSSTHKFELRGYKTYRQDRAKGKGGGTAVCVREGIKSERISVNFVTMEGTVVRIKDQNGADVYMVALYQRPREVVNAADLNIIVDMIGSSEAIIGADLNARHPAWGGGYANKGGRVLHEWLLSCPTLDIRRSSAPTRGLSFIDIFLTTVGMVPVGQDQNGMDVGTLDYESDHRAIEMVVGMDELETQELVEMYDFGRLNRRILNGKLLAGLAAIDLPANRNLAVEEIEAAAVRVGEVYADAMKEAIPKVKPSRGTTLPLPEHILGLIAQKKRLKRTAYRTNDPIRVVTIRAEIRNVSKIIDELIVKYEEDYWVDKLEKIKPSPMMHRKVKQFCGISNRKRIPRLVHMDGSVIDDDRGKANLLAEKFQSIQSSRATGGGSSEKLAAIADLRNHTPMVAFSDLQRSDIPSNVEMPFKLITPEEVGAAIKRLNNKKSSGPDGIPNFVVRKTDQESWAPLAILFNNCFNVGYFPVVWKRSRVVPILKPGKDPTDAASYRPIALLSNIGKLFEKVILDRVNVHLEDERVLLDSQFGFRKGLSTGHALMAVTDEMVRGFNRRRSTIAVGLDFEKAFDTVWREGIVYKMKVKYKFPDAVARMVYDYLMDRAFTVRIDGDESRAMETRAGVPQGSILGPVLYNLYLADIPQPENGEGLYIFADDILLTTSHARAKTANNRMQNYMDVLQLYFEEWYLKLNVPKCTCMVAKGKRKRLYKNARKFVPKVQVGGVSIANAKSMVYLGVKYSEDMEFREHVDMILQKMRKVYALYARRLRGRNGLSMKVKLLVYKQVIRPILAYAFPIWGSISSAQMERLRKAERRMLRHCLGVRAKVDELGIWTFPSCKVLYARSKMEKVQRLDVWMTELAVKFLERCSHNDVGNAHVEKCKLGNDEFDSIMQTGGALTPMGLLKLHENKILYNDDGKLVYYHRRYRKSHTQNYVYNTAQ